LFLVRKQREAVKNNGEYCTARNASKTTTRNEEPCKKSYLSKKRRTRTFCHRRRRKRRGIGHGLLLQVWRCVSCNDHNHHWPLAIVTFLCVQIQRSKVNAHLCKELNVNSRACGTGFQVSKLNATMDAAATTTRNKKQQLHYDFYSRRFDCS
jgi:hypothetical protein